MRRAFTLIELLVVIAIIAVLAAVLFPVFSRAKLAAKKTVDLSNLKQTDLASTMYAGDNEDRFPLNTPTDSSGDYIWGGGWDLPWDLRAGQDALYYQWNLTTWGNSIQPYLKSGAVMASPDQNLVLPAFVAPQEAPVA